MNYGDYTCIKEHIFNKITRCQKQVIIWDITLYMYVFYSLVQENVFFVYIETEGFHGNKWDGKDTESIRFSQG